MKLSKNQREIEQEIEWYKPKRSIANFLRKLSADGFSFAGHGVGFGAEHFGLSRRDWYVGIEDYGAKVEVEISRPDEDEKVFTGTIGKATKFLKV